MNSFQREKFNLGKNDKLSFSKFIPDKFENLPKVISVKLSIELRKKDVKVDIEDVMIIEWIKSYYIDRKLILSEGVPFIIEYEDKNLMCTVEEIETNESIKNISSSKTKKLKKNYGVIENKDSVNFSFESIGGVKIKLTKTGQKEIFTQNFNFNDIGIGGLDEEFNKIFRKIFTSRL